MPLSTFRQVFLPYGLSENGSNKWSVFNREYLPLGSISRHDVKPQASYTFPVDLAPYYDLVFFHHSKNEATGQVTGWLYNDGCLPDGSTQSMKVYQARLALLACLSNRDLSPAMQEEQERLIKFLRGKHQRESPSKKLGKKPAGNAERDQHA